MSATSPSCRPGCGACCIAPSISSPIPGMPVVDGVSKAAGVRCIHLDGEHRCAIFGRPDRPQVCASLMPSFEMCGEDRTHALQWIGWLESQTAP